MGHRTVLGHSVGATQWPSTSIGQIKTDAIGELDGLATSIEIDIHKVNIGFGAATVPTNVVITAWHAFAFINNSIQPPPPSSVQIRTVREDVIIPLGKTIFNGMFSTDTDAQKLRADFGLNGVFARGMPTDKDYNGVTVGKYIGTMINVAVHYEGLIHLIPPFTQVQFQFTGCRVYARPFHGSLRGYDGPAHIMRYEDLGVNQGISLAGQANMQVVSKASLNQIIKLGDRDVHLPANMNVLTLVKSLFMSTQLPQWKCCWSQQEWNHVSNRNMEADPAEFLGSLIKTLSPSDQVLAQSSAAGFFSSLGNVIGGGLDYLTQSSGSFGGRNGARVGSQAAGQFGMSNHAGGQFGMSNQARGQFGINR